MPITDEGMRTVANTIEAIVDEGKTREFAQLLRNEYQVAAEELQAWLEDTED